MKNIRIIPLLHIKGPNVVKPVHTEALRIVGDPKVLAERYSEDGADELLYLDIVASLYRRNLDIALLTSITEHLYIPVTVGGGIRTIHDINSVLRAGADKVAINTYAVHHPAFIAEAAKEFGSQCIVAFIEAKRQPEGWYEAYTDGGRERSGKDAVAWAAQAVALGAGEILIASIDRDGTRRGYDTDLIARISAVAPVPVIVHGGAGSAASLYDAIRAGADALAVSSVFHYGEETIPRVKQYLDAHGAAVRLL